MKKKDETIYSILKKDIISGKRKSGEVFNEKAFAEEMSISRTPVREAVLRLSSEGLMDVISRRGTFVSHISMGDIKYMYQMRKILEPQIVAVAAEKCDKTVAKQWKAFFKEERATGVPHSEDCILPGNVNIDVYPDADAYFHIFIAESTGNRFFLKSVKELMTLTQRIRCLSGEVKEDRLVKSAYEHFAIAKALGASDREGAAKAMVLHLENSEKAYGSIGFVNILDSDNFNVF